MTVLHLDFETRGHLDVRDCGVHKYSSDRHTQVLLLGWAFDSDPVKVWEFREGPLPTEICQAIQDGVRMACHNSTFERLIFKNVLKVVPIPPGHFRDTMVMCRYLSLPGSLAEAGTILGFSEDEAKIKDGRRLINLFSFPFSMGGDVTLFGVEPPCYHDWNTNPRDWELFKEYCKRDVEIERKIYNLLLPFDLPANEWKLWELDQKINDTGIPINVRFVDAALKLAQTEKDRLLAEMKTLTGLENPNSRDQMLEWVRGQKYPYESLGKEFVAAALESKKLTPLCQQVLTLRKESSKTSYKKFEAVKNHICEDGRLRGEFIFMGAARTGRWSSAGGMQVHNQPRPDKKVSKKLDLALKLILEMDRDELEKEFGSVMKAIASCIRSACQAPEGQELHVCDLSAIENRVLMWLARCPAGLEVYAKGQDPYLAFAAKMYSVPYENLAVIIDGKHKPKDKDAEEKRQIAKPPVLGLGYSLGPGVERKNIKEKGVYAAVLRQDSYGNTVKTGLLGYAEKMGVALTPEQSYLAWEAFRAAYPEVVVFWRELEQAATIAIVAGRTTKVGFIEFDRPELNGKYVLRMKLPSGRYLHYLNPRIETRQMVGRDGKPYEKDSIIYDGFGHGVGKMQEGWGPTANYGGKLAEEGTQSISRDVLANGMILADEIGLNLFLHVHDELGASAIANDPFSPNLLDLRNCMCQSPEWAETLPLDASGYSGQVYKKE